MIRPHRFSDTVPRIPAGSSLVLYETFPKIRSERGDEGNREERKKEAEDTPDRVSRWAL